MSRSGLDQILESAFRIRRGEEGRVVYMFLYLLGVVSTFIVGRTVRDTLFLSRYPVDRLPLMYVATAVGVSLAAYLYSRYADRHRRDRVIIVSLGVGCGLLGLTWLAITAKLTGPWIYPALYVAVEIVGGISVIQFWTFANDIFSSREAKRLFGIIGAGGVIANVLCGFAIGGLAMMVGTENLILISVLLLALCISCVRGAARHAKDDLEAAARRPKKQRTLGREGAVEIFRSKHLKLIAAIVAVTVLSVTIIDFQFKIIARAAFEGRENALASFFGYFFGFTGIVACLIQFFLTSRILERRGIIVSLLILPAALFFGAASIVLLVPLVPLLVAGTFTKGSENVVRYTLNDATMQLLYVPVPAHQRGRAKAFIDGILKPVFTGASGLLILAIKKLSSGEQLAITLGWVDLLLLATWLLLVISIRSEYVRSLLSTLRSRRLDLSSSARLVNDETTVRALEESLRAEDETEVLHALELLPSVDADLRDAVAPLLAHRSTEVRITSLAHLAEGGRLDDLAAIERLFADPVEDVRAAAVQAYCAVGGNRAIRAARHFLHDSSPVVRAAVVTGLIKYGGLDGILSAAESLKALLTDPKPEVRVQGARVLASIGVGNFFQPVLELLQDPVLEVRLAGIDAAAAMKSRELVPSLIYRLGDRATSRAAARALASFGEVVEPVLLKVLAHEQEDRAIRNAVPRILAKIGGEAALGPILDAMGRAEPELGAQLARAAARIRERVRHFHVDEAQLAASMRNALSSAYQRLAIAEDLELPPDDLLGDALMAQHNKYLELGFRLLEIRYEATTIELVRANLASENKLTRANATEVIDNLISSEESRLILPLLEDSDRAAKVRAGRDRFDIVRREPEAWIAELLGSPDPWTVACTLDRVRRYGFAGPIERIVELSRAPDPVVRESSIRCLTALLGRGARANEAVRGAADTARGDASPLIREAGSKLLASIGSA